MQTLCAAQVMRDIVQRTADGMADEGAPFTGILFAGLMIKDGKVGSLTSSAAASSSLSHFLTGRQPAAVAC